MANGIIADPEVLEEEYIPQNIPCREVHKKELALSLSPIERRMKPLDCLCHGRPGTRKTAVVKYVLQQVRENTNTLTMYVNCWENKTLNLILDRLVEQLNLVVAEKNYSVKLSRVRQKIGNAICVVTLDQVDKLDRKVLSLSACKGIFFLDTFSPIRAYSNHFPCALTLLPLLRDRNCEHGYGHEYL